MEKIIIEEMLKDCKWYERIIVRMFRKTFIKIYHINRIKLMNNILK